MLCHTWGDCRYPACGVRRTSRTDCPDRDISAYASQGEPNVMKCPKCKYVSHDYLDACRKCGVDLVTFKQEIGLFVIQPGVLDLSLVLGGAGADDLFENVGGEASLHASDDDFDISLDDYAEHPGVRRAPAGAPRPGRPESETDLAGMDHLTLELDASDMPAEMTTRLREARVLPDEPPPVPT